MTSKIIDLTSDNDNSPTKFIYKKSPQSVNSTNPTSSKNGDLEVLFNQAIDGMNEKSLRALLKKICAENASAMVAAQREVLITSDKVVRYHADRASEDREVGESEKENEDSNSEELEDPKEGSKRKAEEAELGEQPVYVSRYAKCEHCKEQFDVTTNSRGDCVWHTDIKDVYNGDDFWADDPHPTYESLENEPDYQDGFMWQCCGKLGSDKGCKKTKHKAMKVQERKKPRH